jgi:APA family basic amino acid/polyamine antiporter
MCTALVVGNMIGSGVFLLPASLAPFGGISIIGWLVTAVGAMMLALVFARLSRLIPRAGGPYAYTRYGFGDFAGFLVAWGYWISIWAGNAAIAVAFAGYLGVFLPGLNGNALLSAGTALAAIWFLTWINARGVREAGILQVVTTILKLAPLAAVGILGLFYLQLENFTPFNLTGGSDFSAITATAAFTLWAFLGLESATIPAAEVKDPERTIPRATISGTALAAVVYILGTVAVMGVLPPDLLARSSAPFADAASRMWGEWAAYAIAAGAVISCFGALNGWILLQGQLPMAAEADDLFPGVFGRRGRSGAPVAGLVVSSLLITILVGMNYSRGLVDLYSFIILLATFTTLVPYVFSTAAELLIFIRERERFNGRRMRGAAGISIVALIYSLWAFTGIEREALIWGTLLLAGGLPVYLLIRGTHPRDRGGSDRLREHTG